MFTSLTMTFKLFEKFIGDFQKNSCSDFIGIKKAITDKRAMNDLPNRKIAS